ncbi:MFS transporter [Actinomadura opuntiae]|uniref:MFS transporter n=1 Tax=Actinomadura sp. OS1-43 TaxID=604315 RepID=UPI00255AF6EA|nr:MFS transporter [Actinomadura sp. OS1-43]MDL4814807.1 MFS transporter [Actinomadura sp. OS1-43]
MRAQEVQEETRADGAYRWRWAALATLLVAEAMNLLDATIVQVAAPVIRGDLGGGESAIQWFSAAYTLPFAVLLITGGRLGDIAGRRRMFAAGVAGFAAASLCCALAPAAGALIAARAVQGAAAALIIPQTFGLIRAMFDGREMAKALGSIGPVMGLAAICGPVLGAVLTHAVSWRAAFLVNVPLAVAVLAAVPVLREDRAERRPRLDVAGTVLAVAGAALLVYPLIQGNSDGWPAWMWAMLAGGVLVLAAFGLYQRRAGDPLIEPSLFGDRGFPAALVTSTLFFAVMNGLMVVVVLQIQLGLGRDVLNAGLTLLPWSAAMAAASWLAGARLVPRFGPRLMFAGLAIMLAGVGAAIAAYHAYPHSYPWPLLGALAVAGAGNGLFTVPFFTAALSRVLPQETGSAAGLLNAVQQFGGTLGIAVLGTAFFRALPHGPASAAQAAFAIAAALLVLTVASAALIRPRT